MKSTRIAILDLGTNTFHLLIADVLNGQVQQEILKDYRAVKLGEGGITKGFITTEAIHRGLDALKQFKEIIQKHHAVKIKAVATSAIRDAKNGKDFIELIFTELQIAIEVINGEREAELIYKGVRAAIKMDQNPVLIMDIGGGSVEFIFANAAQLFWKKSYPVGAARLMEQFHKSDPISLEDISKINTYFDESLAELLNQLEHYKPATLIGSAGAFETFAELVTNEFNLPKENLDASEYSFNQEQLEKIWNMILLSSHDQRSKMQGIIPLRVDMIVVATILTQYIQQKSGIKELKLSGYALREGVLYDMIEEI
ncbi:MAG: exopolyphosphatase [Sphingobacteriales bacterium]|nr:exopolyphosphatase [Sphingobacteriales bacterium]